MVDPATAYLIYQGGKAVIGAITGAEKKKAAERAAKKMETAAGTTASGVEQVGKGFYGQMDIIGDKASHSQEKLMDKVGSKLSDVYAGVRDAPATFASNASRENVQKKAVKDLWDVYETGKKDNEFAVQDMKLQAFQKTFSQVSAIEKQVGTMMGKVKNLRG